MRYKVISIGAICVALLAITLGRAGASGTIDGSSIKDFSIGGNKLATGAVGSRAIFNRSIFRVDLSPSLLASLQRQAVEPGVAVRGVIGGDFRAADVAGYSVVPGTGASQYGFKLHWVSTGPGSANNTFIDAVWAYHAP